MGVQGGPGGFVGPRSVAPAQYLRQSPTPPNVSPASMQLSVCSNQMVPSPALVPSPSNPQLASSMQGSMRSCLNTPVGAGSGGGVPTPSPCGLHTEDTVYRDKIRQLSKYIEPLRRMIARVGNDDLDKLSKMKTLLDMLVNPNKRMPLETLLKCEVVLEKMDLKRVSLLKVVREQHPLIEALKSHLQSPVINHTLHRTFGPCMEALFGSDIKMLPPPLKKKKMEEPVDDIPEVLQGEIARLDQRFKVSLDPTQSVGSRSVQLLCWLDDRHLPCVPPVCLSVPEDYPATPPKCHLPQHDHSSTQFLLNVQSALDSRISKLPSKFTVSQLLDTWEMSVRQACAPQHSPVSATTIIMGL
ncbi:hypothetical protein AAG570_001984 [Ranatra chinensis]|uniref:Mediator complex subunit 15 n=1 Tax=Ranatra chinensis TaxID=642074 RepID=A0ABD0YYC0_9HEMI